MKNFKILINGFEAVDEDWEKLKLQHKNQTTRCFLQHFMVIDKATNKQVEIYNIKTK